MLQERCILLTESNNFSSHQKDSYNIALDPAFSIRRAKGDRNIVIAHVQGKDAHSCKQPFCTEYCIATNMW